MKFVRFLASRRHTPLVTFAVVMASVLVSSAAAQTCTTSADMDPGTRSALQQAGEQFFQMAARGDVASMQAQAAPSLAASFGGVTNAVNENKPNLTGAQASVRNVYLLDAPGTATIADAEFYCGVWNTPDFTGFRISNLPPGRYAIVIDDVKGGKAPLTMLLVLNQAAGNGWKLAGFYTKLAQIAGHDANWFLEQARQLKARGQTHSAWFYYLEALEMLKPVPFMSTRQLDQIYSEAEGVKPADMPPGAPLTLSVGGKTITITQASVVPASDGLDVAVRYQSPDISNTLQTYTDNLAVAKALVVRYPEFRQTFAGVWVTALGPNNGQYSSPVPMKDIK